MTAYENSREAISNFVSTSHQPQVLSNAFNSPLNPYDAAGTEPKPKVCENFLRCFIDDISAVRSSATSSALDPSAPLPRPAVLGTSEPVSSSLLSEVVHHRLRPTVGSSGLVLIKASLLSGCVPSSFQHDVVQPPIRRTNLTPSALTKFQTE